MSEAAEADRKGRFLVEPDLDEFLRGDGRSTGGLGSTRSFGLKLRGRLRLVLYLAGGVLAGAFILSRPAVDALTFLGLFALWVFLGIPACCKLER